MEFEVDDYQCSNGRYYVRELLSELSSTNKDLWSKIVATILKLKLTYYHKEPHSEALGDGLFCARIKSKTDIARVFYTYGKGRMVYLLRGFVKKDQRLPNDELKKARNLKREFDLWKEKKYVKK